MIAKINVLIKKNMKVISNYFHMTFLHVLNSFFYLLIYPYVIGKVGLENYGLYVFFNSLVAYFSVFIDFGFDAPAAGEISKNPTDKKKHAELLSVVLTAKIILLMASGVILFFLLIILDLFLSNFVLFLFCFLAVFSSVFLPVWYFHGMQKMKILTWIQLIFKLISLVFIYFFVDVSAISIYALIVSLTSLMVAFASAFTVYYYFGVRFKLSSIGDAAKMIKDTWCFFLSSAVNVFKQKSLELIIGYFFGMKEVAIYDLAKKIFSVPTMLISSINAALYPKMINNKNPYLIKRIIILECLIGAVSIFAIMILGDFVIEFLPIKNVSDSYFLAVLLGFNIIAYLVVGAIVYFIFIPCKKYEFILNNQLASMASFLIFCVINMYISFSVYSAVFALVLSGFFEVLYCSLLVKKLKFFKL